MLLPSASQLITWTSVEEIPATKKEAKYPLNFLIVTKTGFSICDQISP
jgi:hypothetical protein